MHENFNGVPKFEEGAIKFTNLVNKCNSSNRINNLNDELRNVSKNYVYRIPMTVICVGYSLKFRFRGTPDFSAERRGGQPAPTPIAGSANNENTVIQTLTMSNNYTNVLNRRSLTNTAMRCKRNTAD